MFEIVFTLDFGLTVGSSKVLMRMDLLVGGRLRVFFALSAVRCASPVRMFLEYAISVHDSLLLSENVNYKWYVFK